MLIAEARSPFRFIRWVSGGGARYGAMSLALARELFIVTRNAVLPVIAGGFVIGAVARGDVERLNQHPGA